MSGDPPLCTRGRPLPDPARAGAVSISFVEASPLSLHHLRQTSSPFLCNSSIRKPPTHQNPNSLALATVQQREAIPTSTDPKREKPSGAEQGHFGDLHQARAEMVVPLRGCQAHPPPLH
ncbi:uncharacterized protein J3R85_018668 [Psidium guajava]|nr:uncharacterized protein J3R85_018668 [Psidium guajava]